MAKVVTIPAPSAAVMAEPNQSFFEFLSYIFISMQIEMGSSNQPTICCAVLEF